MKVCRGCHGTGWIRVKARGACCAAPAPPDIVGILRVPHENHLDLGSSHISTRTHKNRIPSPNWKFAHLIYFEAFPFLLSIIFLKPRIWLEVKLQPDLLLWSCFVSCCPLLKSTICHPPPQKKALSFPTFSWKWAIFPKPWNRSDTD